MFHRIRIRIPATTLHHNRCKYINDTFMTLGRSISGWPSSKPFWSTNKKLSYFETVLYKFRGGLKVLILQKVARRLGN